MKYVLRLKHRTVIVERYLRHIHHSVFRRSRIIVEVVPIKINAVRFFTLIAKRSFYNENALIAGF